MKQDLMEYYATHNTDVTGLNNNRNSKMKAIWLETSGCFGEVISLLDADNPDALYFLNEIVDLQYFGSIMGDEGEQAYERILNTLDEEYIFLMCGAIPMKSQGLYSIMATYKGERITATDIVAKVAKNAKYIVAIGTCACYGGPTAARPNLSEAISLNEYLKRNDVIRLPGCPTNPIWIVGTVGYIVNYGLPELDTEGRPVSYYGQKIHDSCLRRRYFDAGIFAKKFGDPECMFKLGCKGPVTNAYCAINRWNGSDNWPIGTRTNCIGCVSSSFPDGNEPFVKY